MLELNAKESGRNAGDGSFLLLLFTHKWKTLSKRCEFSSIERINLCCGAAAPHLPNKEVFLEGKKRGLCKDFLPVFVLETVLPAHTLTHLHGHTLALELLLVKGNGACWRDAYVCVCVLNEPCVCVCVFVWSRKGVRIRDAQVNTAKGKR